MDLKAYNVLLDKFGTLGKITGSFSSFAAFLYTVFYEGRPLDEAVRISIAIGVFGAWLGTGFDSLLGLTKRLQQREALHEIENIKEEFKNDIIGNVIALQRAIELEYSRSLKHRLAKRVRDDKLWLVEHVVRRAGKDEAPDIWDRKNLVEWLKFVDDCLPELWKLYDSAPLMTKLLWKFRSGEKGQQIFTQCQAQRRNSKETEAMKHPDTTDAPPHPPKRLLRRHSIEGPPPSPEESKRLRENALKLSRRNRRPPAKEENAELETPITSQPSDDSPTTPKN